MPKSVAKNAPRVDPPAKRRRPRPDPSGRLERLAIRPMDVADVADVAALEARVFPDPWSADSFLAEIERRPDIGYPVVVRDAEGQLMAYAIIWFIVDEIHIGNIAVCPSRQGEGLGAFLLKHVMAEGRRREMAFATLEVRPSNERAVRLYERFGFRKVAVRKRYYRNDREDAHVLAVPLAAGVELPIG